MPVVTRQLIQQHSTQQSFERGKNYLASGAVHHTIQRGDRLIAIVDGSQPSPYNVSVTLDKAGIQTAECTCPYDWGGYCKHIVAVLLAYIEKPDQFEKKPTVDELLSDLPADQLRRLLGELLTEEPQLVARVEATLEGVVSDEPSSQPTRELQTQVNSTTYRRQVQYAISQLDHRRHWETISTMVRALSDVHRNAIELLDAGDFDNALTLMCVLGEEVIPQYGGLEEECQLADFLNRWADDLTIAILGAGLDSEKHESLCAQLEEWAAKLDNYALDDVLDPPIAACAQGWDAPPADEQSEWFVDLTDARLDVLERRGNTAAYLQFCLDQGTYYRYVQRLIELERTDDAVQRALKHVLTAPEFLALSKLLREEKGNVETAYQLALKGLEAEGSKWQLGQWLAALAEGLGHTDDALRAWRAAFDEHPSLEAYQNLKRLAGDRWPDLRTELITRLEQKAYKTTLIEVLLEEEEIERAIRIWDEESYSNYRLLEKLVDAAADTHLGWAIEKARQQTEGLINRGSKYYPPAVRWLGRAKAIYHQHDRADEWQSCLADIREKHGRKYSLMGQLDELEDN